MLTVSSVQGPLFPQENGTRMVPKRAKKPPGETHTFPAQATVPISNFFAPLAEQQADQEEASTRRAPSCHSSVVALGELCHLPPITAAPAEHMSTGDLPLTQGVQEKASLAAASSTTAVSSPDRDGRQVGQSSLHAGTSPPSWAASHCCNIISRDSDTSQSASWSRYPPATARAVTTVQSEPFPIILICLLCAMYRQWINWG